jgi:hypothetical protein
VLGPLIFGALSAMTGGNQRAAILGVGTMFLIGLAGLANLRAGLPVQRGLGS